jgi:hypothetical protein
MKQRFITAVIISIIAVGIIGQISIHMLDMAAAKQCLTHDWPATADQIHKEWCVYSGYKI